MPLSVRAVLRTVMTVVIVVLVLYLLYLLRNLLMNSHLLWIITVSCVPFSQERLTNVIG